MKSLNILFNKIFSVFLNTCTYLISETDFEPSLVHNLIDRDVYLQELDKLKPHAHTLLTMLNEIRHKLRAMDPTDPRVPTYK